MCEHSLQSFVPVCVVMKVWSLSCLSVQEKTLHTHVATHVHAEGVTAVLRCTVTAAEEGKREGKTRGGVFSDLLLLGKE